MMVIKSDGDASGLGMTEEDSAVVPPSHSLADPILGLTRICFPC